MADARRVRLALRNGATERPCLRQLQRLFRLTAKASSERGTSGSQLIFDRCIARQTQHELSTGSCARPHRFGRPEITERPASTHNQSVTGRPSPAEQTERRSAESCSVTCTAADQPVKRRRTLTNQSEVHFARRLTRNRAARLIKPVAKRTTDAGSGTDDEPKPLKPVLPESVRPLP